MDRHTLEQFRARARRVSLPEEVRESVLDKIRIEKGERARGPLRPHREQHGITRRTFVRMGAVAAGSLAAFLGGSALMSHLGGEKSNWFALTAYAEGTDQDNGTVLAAESFGGNYSFSEADGNTLIVGTSFNVSCVGAGIKTARYELQGSAVSQGDMRFEWFVPSREQAGNPVGGSTTAFTVDYADHSEQVCYNVTMTLDAGKDELREALESLHDLSSTTSPTDRSREETETVWRAFDLVRAVAGGEFARRMEGVELAITATFEDGSTQECRYRFEPVEDAGEKYGDYLARITDLELQREFEGTDTSVEVQELRSNPPSLYLITELC